MLGERTGTRGRAGVFLLSVLLVGSVFARPLPAAESPAPFLLVDEDKGALAAAVIIEAREVEAWEDPGRGGVPSRFLADFPGAVRLSELPDRHLPVWKRFRVLNANTQPLDWVVRVLPPLFESVEVHVFDSSGVQYHHALYELGKGGAGGSLVMPMPGFRIPFRPGVSTIVMRSLAMDTEQATLYLDPVERAFSAIARQHAIMGVYLGVIGALTVYNLLIWAVLRFSFIAHYLAFMLSWGILAAVIHGYMDFLFPWAKPFARWIGPFTHLGIITGTVFMRTFLKTAALTPRLDAWHRFAIFFSLFLWFISLTPLDPYLVEYTSPGLELFVGVQTLMIWFTGLFVVFRRDFPPARMFAAGWTVSVMGIGILLLYYRGLLPQNDLTRFSIQYSSTIEMVLLAFAIGERLRQLDREQIMMARAKFERDKLRSLIGFMVHDLASPLTVIQMQAEMGSRGGPFEWGRISEAVKQQRNILNFIRKEGAEPAVATERSVEVADLENLSVELRALFGLRAETKGVTLELPSREEVAGIRVRADEVVLFQSILGNLVGNSLKYSSRGGTVSLRVSLDGPKWVLIAVKDGGIGIPESLLSRIESGTSGDGVSRPGTEFEPGTGKGLSIVRRFVTSYGGTMDISSRADDDGQAGTGTVVRVRLIRA